MSVDGSPPGGAIIVVDSQSVSDGAVGVKVAVAGPAPVTSTLVDYGPLFGRNRDLAAIDETLKDPRKPARLIHSGKPGIGKSHLVNAYGATHRASYPGGTFLIEFGADPALRLARLITPSVEQSIADRAFRFLASIGHPTLLIYDGVPSESELAQWLPGAGLPVHVLVTTTSANWSGRHTVYNLQPLDEADARAIVEGVCGSDAARKCADILVHHAAGIAVQLRADCEVLRHQLRHGRPLAFQQSLKGETSSSFAQAFALLTNDAQLVMRVAALFNPSGIPYAELSSVLLRERWDRQRADKAIDDAVDRLLLGRDGESFRMHGLVVRFVRALQTPAVPDAVVAEHRNSFVGAARLAGAMPTDMALRQRLANYPSLVSEWDEMGIGLHPVDCHTVGGVLIDAGRFREAQGWLQRALAGKAGLSATGPVDHGSTAHEIGYCLASLGQYEDAQRWFERAATDKEKGNAKGIIDHASLAGSLQLVAHCLVRSGRYEDAKCWSERAVAACERGDVSGCVNYYTLAISQYKMGLCLSGLRSHSEARQWYERAASSYEKGGGYRQIDFDGIGACHHQIGEGLISLSQYAEARVWSERASNYASRGDKHGRVNHASVASSMHQVAFCLSSLNQYAESKEWGMRALEEELKGDWFGRGDYENVGRAMQEIGYCLLNLGQYQEACSWYERAVSAKEKGDVHGQVKHDSLSLSAHQVGFCLWRLGRHEEARPWFERAVAEMGKGNFSGRVNRAGLRKSLTSLGHCLATLGSRNEAQQCFQRAAGLPMEVPMDVPET